jgi:glycosidase
MTWWSASGFYEVYVRSFQDSNDDGVGDLNGITSRLPYLQDLGIDAIWVTPFYASPHVCFYTVQPDLNWRNPEVEERMLEVLGFWLDRGVDGFRLDAVNALFEDVELRDNPPELHDTLRRLRRFVDRRRPDALLISEAYVSSADELTAFDGGGDEMHLPFNFFLAQVPHRDAAAVRDVVERVERACNGRWPCCLRCAARRSSVAWFERPLTLTI